MEWGAVVLVLAGAFAGTGGTAFHDWLRYRREREQRISDLQRDSVLAFANVATRFVVAVSKGKRLSDAEFDEILSESAHTLSRLQLFCPELDDPAMAVARAFANQGELGEAVEAFHVAARNVLGVK